MTRLYRYVGPEGIRQKVAGALTGVPIHSGEELAAWICTSGQRPNPLGLLVVTFVVDGQGILRIADRGSEHVACAAGGPVLSAGELFLRAGVTGWVVAEVTNQSTGFCPEPESWPAVAAALDRAGIPHPGWFTHEVVFRKCPACGQRNVVKDDWFVCGVCGAELPAAWNFHEGESGDR